MKRLRCLAIAFLISFAAFNVHADTAVGGAISINTTWSATKSPYIVNSDVVVQNGAILTIEAGTMILMAGGTNFSVESGTLKAVGNAQAPIKITSQKALNNQGAAPGDWGQLIFNIGANSATTLEYVQIEYGKGIAVTGAAPTFNYVTLKSNKGAAITADLSASPAGLGNQAIGNDLNAVVLPSGDITKSVTWGLRGIPYYIPSGTLSVGPSPRILGVSPNVLQQGETQTFTLTGSRLSGLTQAAFDLGGISAQVLAGATDTQAQLQVNASATAVIGAGNLSAIVDAGEVKLKNALTVLASQPKLTSLVPSIIWVGQGEVALSIKGQNFSNKSVAYLNATPLATTYVSAAEVVATLPNQTTSVAHIISLRTPASSGGGQDFISNDLPLTVQIPALTLSPDDVTFSNGSTQNLSLKLSYPAPQAGIAVNLVSSVPSVANVAPNVSFSAGEITKNVTVTSVGVGKTVITASKVGFSNAVSNLTIVPPPSLTIDPLALNLGVGRNTTVTVTSSVAAGDGGLNVNFTSSNSSIATVPANATIPAGAKSVTVNLSPLAIGSTTITAQSQGFVSGKSEVSVRAVSLVLPLGALVPPGQTRSIPLNLSDPAPAGGLVVHLQSSNVGVLTVPANVTVSEGQTAVNVPITGVGAGSSTLTASATGYQAGNSAITVETITASIGVNSISLPQGATSTYDITLSRPAPVGGVTLSFVVGDGQIASVTPSTITIPQGQTSGGVVKATVKALAQGTTTLVLSAPGLSNNTINFTTLPPGQLRFSNDWYGGTQANVGKGMYTSYYMVTLYREVNGGSYNGTDALTVNLVSSNPSKLKVPASVVIPAGQSSVYVRAEGVALTGATPVTIDASAQGYTSPSAKMSVNVVDPVVSISGLEVSRGTTSARDDFSLSLNVPSGVYQYAISDIPVNVSIAEASPNGIVPGIYDANGSLITQLMIKKDRTDTYDPAVGWKYGYVGTPTTAGTYKVQGSIAGGSSSLSGVVTVSAPQLLFSNDWYGGTQATVGKGMYTSYYMVTLYRQVNGSSYNGTDAVTVNLVSSDPSKLKVPASVVIPEGQSSVYVRVEGIALTGATPVTIGASAQGYTSPSVKMSVNVVDPIVSISGLEGSRGTTSPRDDFSLNLSVPSGVYQYPVSDIPVNVSIAEASPNGIVPGIYDANGSLITQLMIKKDRTDTYDPAVGWKYGYVGTPTTAGTYKVQASIVGGSSSLSGVVTVSAPQLLFSNDWYGGTQANVGKGMYTTSYMVTLYRQVNGSSYNGTDAVTVNLVSSDPSKLKVPASVVIPEGQSSVYVRAEGIALTGAMPVTIGASAQGYTSPSVKMSVNVVDPIVSISGIEGSRGTTSARDDFSLSLNVPSGAYQYAISDIPVNVSIAEASPNGILPGIYDANGSLITQLTIKKDRTDTYDPAVGWKYGYVGTPTTAGTYKVQASIVGGSSSLSGVVTVSAPQLLFSNDWYGGTQANVGKGMYTTSYMVTLYRQVNGSSYNGTDAVTVNVSCTSTAICTTPATVTIPANQSSVYIPVTGVGIGSTTVFASATGYSSPQDFNITVVQPQLNFSGIQTTLQAGQKFNFNLSLSVPSGVYQYAAGAMPFNLTVSAPDVASVPVSGVIPVNGQTSNTLLFNALAPGQTSITASGSDLTSTTSSGITVTP